jgi:hypothetical protein
MDILRPYAGGAPRGCATIDGHPYICALICMPERSASMARVVAAYLAIADDRRTRADEAAVCTRVAVSLAKWCVHIYGSLTVIDFAHSNTYGAGCDAPKCAEVQCEEPPLAAVIGNGISQEDDLAAIEG